MKKKLITMLAVTGMISMACVAGHHSKPDTVYAADMDNEGYDILEEWDDGEDYDDTNGNTADNGISEGTGTDSGSGTQGNGNATESNSQPDAETSDMMTTSMDYQGSADSSMVGRSHVLDNTPKTADLHIEPVFVFSGGLFFAGLAMILLDKKRN